MSRRLREWIAYFIFVFVGERQQEGAHSVVKQGTQFKTVSGPFVSLQVRGEQLLQLLAKHRDRFMEMFFEMHGHEKLVKWFGLSRHPLYK